MYPEMTWTSDSTEPDVTSGTASWALPTTPPSLNVTVVRIRFAAFTDARAVADLLRFAWHAGRKDGHDELARTIREALRP